MRQKWARGWCKTGHLQGLKAPPSANHRGKNSNSAVQKPEGAALTKWSRMTSAEMGRNIMNLCYGTVGRAQVTSLVFLSQRHSLHLTRRKHQAVFKEGTFWRITGQYSSVKVTIDKDRRAVPDCKALGRPETRWIWPHMVCRLVSSHEPMWISQIRSLYCGYRRC